MEKKLYGFLNYLKEEGKSKSSVKNYKMDIMQFLRFREANLPEASISSAFRAYQAFLDEKYSHNSVLRKASSIKSFIKYSYPFEEKLIEDSKKKTKSLTYITAFSLSLSLILLIVLYSLIKVRLNSEVLSPISIGSVTISSENPNGIFKGEEGIAVSVSAPSIESEGVKDPCKLVD